MDTEKIKTGDVVLCSREPSLRSPLQKGICAVTFSEFHHAEPVLWQLRNGERRLMIANARHPYLTLDPFDVRMREVESGELRVLVLRLSKYWEESLVTSVEATSYLQFRQKVQAILETLAYMQIPYDRLAIVSQLRNWMVRHIPLIRRYEWTMERRFHVYCSELVLIVYLFAAMTDLQEGSESKFFDPRHIEHLYRSGLFRLVTEAPDGFHQQVLGGQVALGWTDSKPSSR